MGRSVFIVWAIVDIIIISAKIAGIHDRKKSGKSGIETVLRV